MIFLILAVGYQGAITASVFELVPTVVRYSVIAVCYNVSYSLFGGTAPFIATYMVNLMGNKAAPGLYLTFGAIVALIAVMQLAKKSDVAA
jgi:MHS family proline/betaine transporter-like MFS transporter